MDIGQSLGAAVGASMGRAAPFAPGRIRLASLYEIECFAPDGALRWREVCRNTVVNAGLDDVLDKYFRGASYTAGFFVGLTTGTPGFVPADTMASHAGWTEFTAYQNGAPTQRPGLALGSVASQSVDNGASKASFLITANGSTIGGAFVTTDGTAGGATGTLYGGASFSTGNKSADANDTLNVTVTLTAASAP